MEAGLYKELSYRVRGFRAVSILVAVVTIVLCLVVGIGCWVLVAGVRENEQLLREVGTSEKFEVEVVEGEIREPLQMKNSNEPLNKVGRVVQHIAEIDFQDGSPVASDPEGDGDALAHLEHAQNVLIQAVATADPPTPTHVNSKEYKTNFPQRHSGVAEARALQGEMGQPIDIDGIVGVRIQPPAVEGTVTNFMRRVGHEDGSNSPNNGHYVKNELSVVQPPAAVYSATHQSSEHDTPDVPKPQEEHHESIIDHIFNFTNEMASDISNQGLFETLAERTSEQYMRDTFHWLGDYTSQLMGSGPQRQSRSKRSIFSLGARLLAYSNYAAFSKFMYNEVNAIAEYNLEARKFSSDAEAEVVDSTFWAATTTPPPGEGAPHTVSEKWEPQVNKVSIEFIGEILNTLLNMMREYLMKDNVMECLWYMFCQDLNHQARYFNVYGVLARVNSVGLKVLVERENRQMDTIGEIWRSLTNWETLQCDVMFPKCDGPKALEIVNDVALGARK